MKEPLWYEPQLQQFIHIDPTNTINPDHDVIATGAYQLGLRKQGKTAEGPLVNVYDAEGKVAGTITLDRLNILQTAFEHTKSTEPEIMEQLGATCFEHEVAKLLIRYQDGHTRHADKHWKTTSLAQQLTTPDTYMHALKTALGLKCERFASPLNFNPEFDSYFSMHDQDRIFGANIDAFSRKWEGASQANPGHTPKLMEKAVRWAVLSAEQSKTACLTAFVLPAQAPSGYYKWLAHPLVTMVCTVNKSNFKYKGTDHWKTGQTYKGNSE